jgi:hypothetical protein
MEDVIVESIQIMGHNCYYIPRESLDDMDMIFGEATKVKFNKAYLIEAYIANTEGFEGDGDFFSKFGLEIRDTSNFVISRRSFVRQVPSSLRERPQEGDLVWVPLLHRMFEIKFIEKKLMFFSLGNRHPFVYEMRCEDFRFSQEQFDTGVEEIDQVEEENAYTIKITLNTSGSGSYLDGETIYQSSDGSWANNTASGIIKEWFKSNGTMFIYNVDGIFANNANVYGNTNHAVYKTKGVIDKTTNFTHDLSDNEEFANNSVLILDLSEINPFGSI